MDLFFIEHCALNIVRESKLTSRDSHPDPFHRTQNNSPPFGKQCLDIKIGLALIEE